MRRLDAVRVISLVLAPIGALAIAAGISSVALLVSDKSPLRAFSVMLEYGSRPD